MGSRVGQGPSKTSQRINHRTKKVNISKNGPDHKVCTSKALGIVLLYPDWAQRDQRDLISWCQEILMVSKPFIQHETSL